MSEEQLLQFIQEGLIYCPSCNRSERIELIYVTDVVDRRVADIETTNVYPVALLKCHDCGFDFELERVDPRVITSITEISFPNDFTVYTTSNNINEAINEAKKWYTSRYDGDLGEPAVRVVGSTIYTSDPYDIVIPSEEGEEQ